jgi:hypothetical protein
MSSSRVVVVEPAGAGSESGPLVAGWLPESWLTWSAAGRSSQGRHPVLQEVGPDVPGLLRVELGGHQRPVLDGRHEG